jgi:glycosyltransferase involved in cell wall biosynthesis
VKILQINGYESPGRRFHGLALTSLLEKQGVQSKHLVWEKDSQNPEVLTFEGKWTRKANRIINRVERLASVQSMLYPHVMQMTRMPAFKEADLIHLHIIHSGYFSLSHLPKITALKPTVWTLHDPWAMTGHCIHPKNCDKWRSGCGQCPDLAAPFPLLRDNTKYLFNYKQRAYKNSNFEVIVASNWMQNMVLESPLFKGVPVHHIPFGLDLKRFSPVTNTNIRQKFGIDKDTLVLCFRATTEPYKGTSYLVEALKSIKTDLKICLLTLGGKGLLEPFRDRFQVIELGWVHDEELVRDVLVAADIFLMPSTAESFGLMAIEAMACAKPVIIFEGTALHSITFAPDVGLSVPMSDVNALAQAIQHLIDNPAERQERGRKGREVAELHYDQELHVTRLVDVYKKVAKK